MRASQIEVMKDKVLYHFPGITIMVPEQDSQVQIVAITRGSISLKDVPSYSAGFTLIRHIANVVLVAKDTYEAGREDPYTGNLDPPVEIYVGYDAFDVMATRFDPEHSFDIHQLKLAFWNGIKWVILSKDDYQYFILPSDTGQVAKVLIHNWVGDPPIAWGT